MKAYFTSEYLTLTYDPNKSIGKAVGNGFLNSEEFRTASLSCLDLIEQEHLLYWIADNRKMKAIRQHDQDWFAQEIIPRLAQSSLQKMATLVSEDLFNQMAVESLEVKANEVVHFDNYHFKTGEEAWLWLTESTLEATE